MLVTGEIGESDDNLYRDKHYHHTGLRWKLIPEHVSCHLQKQNRLHTKPLAAVIDLDGKHTKDEYPLPFYSSSLGTIFSGSDSLKHKLFPNVAETLKKLVVKG